jgi:hypothetical protein
MTQTRIAYMPLSTYALGVNAQLCQIGFTDIASRTAGHG